jgi:hypothetical protein
VQSYMSAGAQPPHKKRPCARGPNRATRDGELRAAAVGEVSRGASVASVVLRPEFKGHITYDSLKNMVAGRTRITRVHGDSLVSTRPSDAEGDAEGGGSGMPTSATRVVDRQPTAAVKPRTRALYDDLCNVEWGRGINAGDSEDTAAATLSLAAYNRFVAEHHACVVLSRLHAAEFVRLWRLPCGAYRDMVVDLDQRLRRAQTEYDRQRRTTSKKKRSQGQVKLLGTGCHIARPDEYWVSVLSHVSMPHLPICGTPLVYFVKTDESDDRGHPVTWTFTSSDAEPADGLEQLVFRDGEEGLHTATLRSVIAEARAAMLPFVRKVSGLGFSKWCRFVESPSPVTGQTISAPVASGPRLVLLLLAHDGVQNSLWTEWLEDAGPDIAIVFAVERGRDVASSTCFPVDISGARATRVDTTTRTRWGDTTIVDATIGLVSAAVSLHPHASHFICLSGRCVPSLAASATAPGYRRC